VSSDAVIFETLETWRLRGDLIEVFKIFKGFDDLDPTIFVNSVKHIQEVTL